MTGALAVVLLSTRSFRARANTKTSPFRNAAGGAFSSSRSKAIKGINCPGRGAHHSRLDCSIALAVVRISVGQATEGTPKREPVCSWRTVGWPLAPLCGRRPGRGKNTGEIGNRRQPTEHLAFGSPLCQEIQWRPVDRLAVEPLLGVVPQLSYPSPNCRSRRSRTSPIRSTMVPSPSKETWQGR